MICEHSEECGAMSGRISALEQKLATALEIIKIQGEAINKIYKYAHKEMILSDDELRIKACAREAKEKCAKLMEGLK